MLLQTLQSALGQNALESCLVARSGSKHVLTRPGPQTWLKKTAAREWPEGVTLSCWEGLICHTKEGSADMLSTVAAEHTHLSVEKTKKEIKNEKHWIQEVLPALQPGITFRGAQD